MQGELSTPHQRVIIGSLWSTWRLRAQRKQLSLHSPLDCLSQQTPFPSPLPAPFLQVPSSEQLTMVHRMKEREMVKLSLITYDAFRSMPAFTLSIVWMRTAAPVMILLGFGDNMSFFSFTKWKEQLKLLNSQVIIPLVTGAPSGLIYAI